MHDENVDLRGVVDQLQAENERLRSLLAKTRKFDLSIPWEKIRLEAANLVSNHFFWIGYFVALVLSYILNRFDREGND